MIEGPALRGAGGHQALAQAREQGLSLPVVYNSNGYDSVETLRLLDGWVDIYMPDAKFFDDSTAAGFLAAGDYASRAREALLEMHRQVGDLQVGSDGIARRGLLVRHLVLPHGRAGTREVMRFIATQISSNTYVNIMGQYRPSFEVGTPSPRGRRRHAGRSGLDAGQPARAGADHAAKKCRQ